MVNPGDNKDVAFKNTPFQQTKQKLITSLLIKLIVFTSQYLCTTWLSTEIKYSGTSGSLCQFKRDEAPADNADLTAGSESIKYIAGLCEKQQMLPVEIALSNM